MSPRAGALQELYEATYAMPNHFSFGKNWQSFLAVLTDERIQLAEASLIAFLGSGTAVRGKSFVDVGSGSGLFSLAAYRLGAKQVLSLDVDEASLASTSSLRDRYGQTERWAVRRGSALNRRLLRSLGTFDVVYSWGVLHHTGAMERAITNVTQLVGLNGQLYLAIYNDSQSWTHGTSRFWLARKRDYNQCGPLGKRMMEWLYATYLWLGLFLSGKNPVRYIRSYQSARGMSWWHDLVDWLGGYPYEFAAPERMITLLAAHGFGCTKLRIRHTIGCSEYLFTRTRA